MPVTQPAGTEAFIAKQGASFMPILLLDIQTLDGSQYFLSDYEGNFLSKLTGLTQFYSAWIKSGCNFTRTRDMTTNAGDLTLQNISGNTIDRDVAAALKNHEFEGAYAVTRLWVPLLDVAIDEFHCALSEQNPKEDEAAFRQLQLFDPTQYFVASDVEAETCTWRFKSAQCGSTGTATSCLKRLIDCQDATRAAQERFNAILTTVPSTVIAPATSLGRGPISRQPGGPAGGGGFRLDRTF
jgi:phage-related protein